MNVLRTRKASRRVGQTRRRDGNEAEIVQALEQLGVVVLRISGKGCPDLLLHYQGIWQPVEVKSARGEPTIAQSVTQTQAPYPMVRTVDEALAVYERMRAAG